MGRILSIGAVFALCIAVSADADPIEDALAGILPPAPAVPVATAQRAVVQDEAEKPDGDEPPRTSTPVSAPSANPASDAAEIAALREEVAALRRQVEDAQKASAPVPDGKAPADGSAESGQSPSTALKIEMVAIPGRNFAICKYEVTQALWEYVMGENPSKFKGADHPVECVSMEDCEKFLKRLNALPEIRASFVTYRLPTADEWQYACRAGASGAFCLVAGGREISISTLADVAWFREDGKGGGTHPVGQKRPNAFGLYDMLGNVSEWVTFGDSKNQLGKRRFCCGGSWLNTGNECLANSRIRSHSQYRDDYIGLRLARNIPKR